MAYKIRWTLNALEDYKRVINYLVMDWSVNIAIDFEAILNKKLTNLSYNPSIGIASQKKPIVRSILITKHNRLYYQIVKDSIVLLNLFDTRQNPEKNIYK